MYGSYSQPRGPQAARLRHRKTELLARFPIPDDLLPGSLSMSKPRCGKPNCHCANPDDTPPHTWTLTSLLEGKKRTLHAPKDWVEDVQGRVQAVSEFLD